MKAKIRKGLSVALIAASFLMFCTTAFAKDPDASNKSSSSNKGSSIVYKGTDKTKLNELGIKAITQTSMNTGRTYGNPGLYDLYSGSSSSSTSGTKKTSSSTSNNSDGSSTPAPTSPAKTPRPGRDDDDDGGSYTPPPVTPDLTVTNITPASYRGNSMVMSTVTVQGLQTAAVNSVEVRFDAGGSTQSKTVNVPASSKATVTFGQLLPLAL